MRFLRQAGVDFVIFSFFSFLGGRLGFLVRIVIVKWGFK
jgi:hypothetical protein